jgi:DNA-binding transcriptional regulator YbjK
VTPPRNVGRRNGLTDAAIEVLGTRGIHYLSHRAVDQAAKLPAGTTSNYFKSRDELLEAVAHRVVELQLEEMNVAAEEATAATQEVDGQGLAALIGRSLYDGATCHRNRFLAIYELSLEATRRPALSEALASVAIATLQATVAHHRALGLQSSPEQVQMLMTLFGGALFALVTAPPELVTEEGANMLARCMVTGVSAELPEPPVSPGPSGGREQTGRDSD